MSPSSTSRLAALALAAFSGCGDDALCVEATVTITQGVYGLVTYRSDVGNQPAMPQPHTSVQVFDAAGAVRVATATTDGDGVYQQELPVGDYAFCYVTASCVTVRIDTSERRRVDFLQAFGGTHFELVPASSCAQ